MDSRANQLKFVCPRVSHTHLTTIMPASQMHFLPNTAIGTQNSGLAGGSQYNNVSILHNNCLIIIGCRVALLSDSTVHSIRNECTRSDCRISIIERNMAVSASVTY